MALKQINDTTFDIIFDENLNNYPDVATGSTQTSIIQFQDNTQVYYYNKDGEEVLLGDSFSSDDVLQFALAVQEEVVSGIGILIGGQYIAKFNTDYMGIKAHNYT